MTRKIARFLADQEPATPCLVVDLDVVAANYRKLRQAMPDAAIYYAVKANPAREILDLLVSLGASFDTAASTKSTWCWPRALTHHVSRSAIRSRSTVTLPPPTHAASASTPSTAAPS